MKITAEIFEKATGHPPVNDDLDRCNCDLEGEVGHDQCGWHEELNLPNFMVPYSKVVHK